MHYTRQFFLLLFLFFSATSVLVAQEKRLISGTLTDAVTHEPLAFAPVALKKQLIGIVTNEVGKFDLYVPAEAASDTLVIGYFGYRTQYFAISSIQGPLEVKMVQNLKELQEVVVRPLKPEEYIRLAMRRVKINYPGTPFETEAYYREKVTENKNLLKCDEGVFKTYYPNYLDTTRTQNQLLLFRRAENASKMAFMSEEREKKAEKEKKTGKKDDKGVEIDLASSFGGPDAILRNAKFTRKEPEGCIDTMKIKSYRYSFAKSSTYNNKELMVIDFETKGKVDHVRESGRVYLDLATFAIVKIESKGDFIIPIIVRPILFLYGLGIENPQYEQNIEFQQIKNHWYPKSIQYNVDVKVSNHHWFKPNEHSDFQIEGVFIVNHTNIEDPSPVPAAKRFDSRKDMKTQVYNDNGLTWEGLNIIKK